MMMIKKALKKSWSLLDAPMSATIERYGDLIYDLCESTLWSPAQAQIAFRMILKKLLAEKKSQSFSLYERAWVLHLTIQALIQLHEEHDYENSPQEQLQLDSESNIESRLKHFQTYFHRLPIQNQLLLLLKDKHNLPLQEIAMAFGTPEGSLKIQHQQSLSILEDWLWKTQ